MEVEKRRLRYRAWRRGTKEMDLILGGFADAHLDSMDEAMLKEFESLLALPDGEIDDHLKGALSSSLNASALWKKLARFYQGKTIG